MCCNEHNVVTLQLYPEKLLAYAAYVGPTPNRVAADGDTNVVWLHRTESIVG